jgi:plasmid stabilization system protein ParE
VEVIFHPLVGAEVLEALRYYSKVSTHLADEFNDELKSVINRAVENPNRFHSVERGFRRANLLRFPYHVIYEVHPSSLRVMVVRHNKRDPEYGLDRG